MAMTLSTVVHALQLSSSSAVEQLRLGGIRRCVDGLLWEVFRVEIVWLSGLPVPPVKLPPALNGEAAEWIPVISGCGAQGFWVGAAGAGEMGWFMMTCV